jgi:hypothetical protein
MQANQMVTRKQNSVAKVVSRMQANQMATRKQNSVARAGANHKETHRPVKEQHVFDFHSHTDDI